MTLTVVKRTQHLMVIGTAVETVIFAFGFLLAIGESTRSPYQIALDSRSAGSAWTARLDSYAAASPGIRESG